MPTLAPPQRCEPRPSPPPPAHRGAWPYPPRAGRLVHRSSGVVPQLLYERNGLPVPWFGVAWALLNVSVAVTSLASPYVYKRMGLYGAQAALGLWGVACWALMGFWQSPWCARPGPGPSSLSL